MEGRAKSILGGNNDWEGIVYGNSININNNLMIGIKVRGLGSD